MLSDLSLCGELVSATPECPCLHRADKHLSFTNVQGYPHPGSSYHCLQIDSKTLQQGAPADSMPLDIFDVCRILPEDVATNNVIHRIDLPLLKIPAVLPTPLCIAFLAIYAVPVQGTAIQYDTPKLFETDHCIDTHKCTFHSRLSQMHPPVTITSRVFL